MNTDLNGLRTLSQASLLDDEPGWLKDLRQKAWKSYTSSPMPLRSDHLWRYTNPEEFSLDFSAIDLQSPMLHTGSHVAYEYDKSFKELGIIVTDLKKALLDSKLAKDVFLKIVGMNHGKFQALNAAIWSQGVYVEIPDGLCLKDPILIRKNAVCGSFMAERMLIVIGENSRVTIVEELLGSSGPGGFLSFITEMLVNQGAEATFMSINNLSKNAKALYTMRGKLERDAQLKWVLASFGGSLFKADYGSILHGKNSRSEIVGVLLGDETQHLDHHTVHDHMADHTFSDIDFRVALKDQAHSTYTGVIRISPEALHSEAFQENNNLLLSKMAKAESIPELEILTDEVRCKHGVTVGPIEEESLFYLMSRGISRDEAVKIIVRGFLEPIMSRIPEALADKLHKEVDLRVATIS